MSSDDLFKYESMQDRESIVKYLYALADGMSKGTLAFNWKGEMAEFHPRGMLHFTVEAKERGARKKIMLKIAWNERDELNPEDAPLIIDSRDAAK